MASQKNIKIKTGTLKRVFKEVNSYEKELQMELARTEKMKAEGADSHDLKQQESVLGETQMMIPDAKKRLQNAFQDLQSAVEEGEADASLQESATRRGSFQAVSRRSDCFSMTFSFNLPNNHLRMVRASDEGFFKNLIDQKEKEIVSLWEQRIQKLEEKLLSREADLDAVTDNFTQLQEDFQYNLSLLEARDFELEAYDASFSGLQAAVVDGERLLKEARSALADAEAQLQEERRRAEEDAAHSRQKVVEAREQVEQAQWHCEEELRKQRQAFEAINGDLMRQVAEAQEALDLQRRELTRQYEENLLKQETESQLCLDETTAKTFGAEQQCKKLERKLRMMEEGVEQLQDDSSKLRATLEAKERQVEALSWELEKVRELRETEGAELQAQLNASLKRNEEMEEDFGDKTTELVAALSAVQQMMSRQQQEHAAELASISRRSEDEAAALKAKVAAAVKRAQEAEAHKLEQGESYKKQVHELELKLEEQTAAAQRSLDAALAASADQDHRLEQTRQELTDQLWRKGAELDAAQSKLDAAQRTLEERRADVANYKEQLVAGAAREKELQRQVVQATLRGEQDAEEKERRAVARSEALILSLQQQRDHANALHKQAEERAAELAHELQRLVKTHQQRPQSPPSFVPPRPSTAPTPGGAFSGAKRPPPIAVPHRGGGASSLGSPLPAPSPIPSLHMSFAASPGPGGGLKSPRDRPHKLFKAYEDAAEEVESGRAGRSGYENDEHSGFRITGDGELAGNEELEEENELLRRSLAGMAAQNEQIRAVVHHMRGEMEELQKRAVVAMTPRTGPARTEGARNEEESLGVAAGGGTKAGSEPQGSAGLGNHMTGAGGGSVADVAGVTSIEGQGGNHGESAGGGGVNTPEVEQLRYELGTVQQRLAQMSARLEPVLTTVQSLQHPGVNEPPPGLFPLYAPAHLPRIGPGPERGQSAPSSGAGRSGFGQGYEGLGMGHAPPGEQLSLALEEVRRLGEERDRLMELSNALRADLKKRTAANPSVNLPNPVVADPKPELPAPFVRPPVGQRSVPLVTTRPLTAQTNAVREAQGKPTEGVRSAAVSKGGAMPPAGAPFVVAGVQAPRPTIVEIIHKGTASQRAKLKAVQQRRQAEPPQVRNYNVRDDREPA
ncbi:hypothetical protein KFL_002060190 [Klebsormidium nitens]|uniref:Uncharacterized protein n=1 Tax=Klebsormidium nitens TaxID=105231 RepID=A0A1Y1I5W4_KLENI|nr:hypothetical protein KFL_002060190 [Klebsormidium nitens]|eukprot:GAQ84799.1 hypothetical protein KFL_002060190 [Klebsormidium nitens]